MGTPQKFKCIGLNLKYTIIERNEQSLNNVYVNAYILTIKWKIDKLEHSTIFKFYSAKDTISEIQIKKCNERRHIIYITNKWLIYPEYINHSFNQY